MGTLSTPRSTRPTSAGNVSSLARSPVAPKMTSASMAWSAIVSPGSRCSGWSGESCCDVVPYAHRVGDRRQGRVHRADAREEAGVHHVEVVQVVGLAADVQ